MSPLVTALRYGILSLFCHVQITAVGLEATQLSCFFPEPDEIEFDLAGTFWGHT